MKLLEKLKRRQKLPTLTWVSMDHEDEPRDQLTDLVDHLWASVGPDKRLQEDGWSWDVQDFSKDNEYVASGLCSSEEEAKAAVAEWFKNYLDISQKKVAIR